MKNRYSHILTVVLAITLLTASGLNASAASVGDFYRGKTVEIYVGTTAGGGYSTFAQILSKHLGNHIPGNPTVIVKHLPGAGGLKALNPTTIFSYIFS